MVMSNQPHELDQVHQVGPHVPVLCGLKWHRSENQTRSIFLTKDLNDEVKSAPRSCSGPPWGTPCPSSLWSEGVQVWKSHHKYSFDQGFEWWYQISPKKLFRTTMGDPMSLFSVEWGVQGWKSHHKYFAPQGFKWWYQIKYRMSFKKLFIIF